MNPKEFTKNQKVRVIYGFDGMHIKDDDVYELMQKYADLQLLQACVSGRSEQLCGNLDENYNCKNMCLTHCIDGNKFYK